MSKTSKPRRARAKSVRPRRRQTVYTRALADEICSRLAAGESLNAICRDAHMPDESAVRGWAQDDRDGFGPKYARAREIQADYHGDRVLRVLETSPQKIITTRPDGTREEKIDPADVARLKNLADGLKWHAGRMKPRTWGDKLEVDGSLKVDVGSVLDAARKRVSGGGQG